MASSFRDQLGSIANHTAGVARSKVQSLHASTKPEIKRLVNDCNQSAVTADCNGLFKNNHSCSGTGYMIIQERSKPILSTHSVDCRRFEYDEKGHGGPDRSATNSETIKTPSEWSGRYDDGAGYKVRRKPQLGQSTLDASRLPGMASEKHR